MIRPAILAAVSVALALAPPEPAAPPATVKDAAAPAEPPRNRETVELALKDHNRERSRAKLPPLALDPLLSAAAQAHADEMARRQVMSHEGADGSTPFDRMKKQGYRFQTAGENVAEGQRTVEAVMDAWMKSPHHRENILGKYTQVGIALARDADGVPYWCVNFGTPWTKLDPDAAAADLIEAINGVRGKADRPALKVNPKLGAAASEIAGGFAKADSFQPAKGGESALTDALKASGYRYRKLSEAAAVGQPDAAGVVGSWTGDEAQRKNLLDDFTEAGAGYAVAPSGTPYWCLILARPLNPPPARP